MRGTQSARRLILLVFAVVLTACAFLPTTTGCSGGPGGADPSLASSQKGTIYYIDDHLGSAQIVADAETGVVYEEVIYPYGLSAGSGSDSGDEASGEGADWSADYSYTTKERDAETGLIYFGKRYYSPDMGRWLTPDKLFLEKPLETLNMTAENNLYAFVGNNPSSYIDLDGFIKQHIGESYRGLREALDIFEADVSYGLQAKIKGRVFGIVSFEAKSDIISKHWGVEGASKYQKTMQSFTGGLFLLKELKALGVRGGWSRERDGFWKDPVWEGLEKVDGETPYEFIKDAPWRSEHEWVAFGNGKFSEDGDIRYGGGIAAVGGVEGYINISEARDFCVWLAGEAKEYFVGEDP